MLYEDIFRGLNKNKVKYAIAGGVAVILHGFTRFTADLDLIVELSEKNLDKLYDTLYKLGYRPKVPVAKEQFIDKKNLKNWVKNKNAFVFSFFHLKDHLKLVDIFIEEPIKFSVIEKKIIKLRLKNMTVPVVSIDHLIKLKKVAHRPQDTIDIESLEEIKQIRKR